MQPTDKIAFTALINKVWRFHRLVVTGQEVADWIGILAAVPFQAVELAFNRHLADPKHGSYLPKPADIFRQLNQASADDGRPGADEAWGLLLRVIRDERETGVLSEEMRADGPSKSPMVMASTTTQSTSSASLTANWSRRTVFALIRANCSRPCQAGPFSVVVASCLTSSSP
ncbi:MAG: hypothetical protein WBC13_06250, partial [Dokdonella sp.]